MTENGRETRNIKVYIHTSQKYHYKIESHLVSSSHQCYVVEGTGKDVQENDGPDHRRDDTRDSWIDVAPILQLPHPSLNLRNSGAKERGFKGKGRHRDMIQDEDKRRKTSRKMEEERTKITERREIQTERWTTTG